MMWKQPSAPPAFPRNEIQINATSKEDNDSCIMGPYMCASCGFLHSWRLDRLRKKINAGHPGCCAKASPFCKITPGSILKTGGLLTVYHATAWTPWPTLCTVRIHALSDYRPFWLTRDLHDQTAGSTLSSAAYRSLMLISFKLGYRLWHIGWTNAWMSMVITWSCDVYHLLPMCLVYTEYISIRLLFVLLFKNQCMYINVMLKFLLFLTKIFHFPKIYFASHLPLQDRRATTAR